MVYRQDNRPKRHRGRFTILGIVLGIVLTIGGFYVYDNYKQPIMDNVSQIKEKVITETKAISDKPVQQQSQSIDNSQQTSQVQEPTQADQQNTTPVKTIDATTLEHEIHLQINQMRQNAGLRPLQYDENLANIAREHSRDMGINNYYDHTTPNGIGLEDRYKNANYICAGWLGENIQQQSTMNNDLANLAFQTWNESPEHRDNMLQPNFYHEGIGVFVYSGTVFITEDFC